MATWGTAKMNWGDDDGEVDDQKGNMDVGSPVAADKGANVSIFESGPDKDGIKTYTEYRTDTTGKKVRGG